MLVSIPCGGLGNRLMALMSAKLLAEYLECPFQIAWRPQAHLKSSNYPLSVLFDGIETVSLADYEPDSGFNYHHHVTGSVPEIEAKLRAGETVFLHSYCFIRPEGMAG